MISNDRNKVRWVVLGLSGWGLQRFIWKSQREKHRMLPLSAHLFSHWSRPLKQNFLKFCGVLLRWSYKEISTPKILFVPRTGKCVDDHFTTADMLIMSSFNNVQTYWNTIQYYSSKITHAGISGHYKELFMLLYWFQMYMCITEYFSKITRNVSRWLKLQKSFCNSVTKLICLSNLVQELLTEKD